MMIQHHEYRTSHTPLAAYLIAEGFEMTRIDYEDDRAFFVFPNGSEDFNKAVKRFDNRIANTNIQVYEGARRDLLERVKRRGQ